MLGVCSLPDCELPACSRGLCNRHHCQQYYRDHREDVLAQQYGHYYPLHRKDILARKARYRKTHHAQILVSEAGRRQRRRAGEPMRAYKRDPDGRAYRYAVNAFKKLIWWFLRRITAQQRRRESKQETTANWRAENPEHVRECSLRYRAKHRQKIRVYRRQYYQSHKEETRNRAQRRRARKKQAAICDLSLAQWREIQAVFDHRCAYCGKKCKGKLTQDHVTPYVHNGSHTLWNVVPACETCNKKKWTGNVLVPVQPLLLTIAKAYTA
jgi:5-methylcytosine-specific restriction endonuclease McrA